MKPGMIDRCLEAAAGDPDLALVYAVRVTRWRMIARGELIPHPSEPLPVEVRHARQHWIQQHLAA